MVQVSAFVLRFPNFDNMRIVNIHNFNTNSNINKGIKIYLLTFLLAISALTVQGQSKCQDSTKFDIYKNKTHNIIGFIPCNARITNGLGIGWSSTISDYCAHMDSIRINGTYINFSPFQVFVAGAGITMLPFVLFMPETYRNLEADTSIYIESKTGNQLNGLGISLFEIGDDFTFNGLHILILANSSEKLNGVSATLFYNEYKKFTGVMLSGVYNKTIEGKGLQIGLVNNSKKMTGLQIGLWNKIGKRGLPFLNMSFKKK